ncbi:MAG: hypothetical protein EU548_07675 [Promethearchaeota archaeon]|nr:MAG: hypothetical protein EU548_07675 [Candidatus Lokiarchaeota archaeon]
MSYLFKYFFCYYYITMDYLSKKFKINKYLSLWMEGGITYIYVNDQPFSSCKYLLLNIEKEDVKSYDHIESIDEAIRYYNQDHEKDKTLLDPKTEFWGHCSNLQAWAENNYDTRLLDSKLSFPLLKRLADEGDHTAKKVFKEEIAKRLCSGNPNIITFLLEGRYFYYFTKEEKDNMFRATDYSQITIMENQHAFPLLKRLAWEDESTAKKVFKEEIIKRFSSGKLNNIIFLLNEQYLTFLTEKEREDMFRATDYSQINTICEDQGWTERMGEKLKVISFGEGQVVQYEVEVLKELESLTDKLFMLDYWIRSQSKMLFTTKNYQVSGLGLNWCGLTNPPESIGNLPSLKELWLHSNRIPSLPESIGNLKSLKELHLFDNKLTTLPESIGDLKSLEELSLSRNSITTLPESIGNLSSLKSLSLGYNSLSTLPESISNLSSLKSLSLYNNKFTTFPESITELTSLKSLSLSYNSLSTLPESIGNLSSLEGLGLEGNNLTTLPKSITKLTSLKSLSLSYNSLSTLPESISNLSSLERLEIEGNNLTTLPESIGKLTSLKVLKIISSKFSTLPKSIGNLTSLKKLWLGFNSNMILPESITKLTSLEELWLDTKSFTTLPEFIKIWFKRYYPKEFLELKIWLKEYYPKEFQGLKIWLKNHEISFFRHE